MGITTKTVINIMYTSRFVEDAVSSVLKPYDLTSQQYNVLRILRGQNGNPANLCTIQERMIDKSSNTTRLVDKLIQKDWAKRSICKTNRRKVEIVITETGLELLKELDPLIEKNNENLVSNLSEEQMEAFNSILDSIRTT